MELESFNKEIILDHYRNPHHAGLREPFDAQAHRANPHLGDELTLRVTLSHADHNPVLADVSYEALGCMTHLASTSIMADLIIGKTVREAMEIYAAFLTLMQSRGSTEPDKDILGDAVALMGVSKDPARIQCALMSWMAWKDATERVLRLQGDTVAKALGFISGPAVKLFSHQVILDHYTKPRHAGLRDPFDAQVHHANRRDNDEVTMRVTLSDADGEPVLADVSYQALGCAINQVSVSVMADLVIGKTVGEARAISDAFLNLMQSRGNTEPDEEILGGAVTFAGLSRYPARIQCVLLGWLAWQDATTLALSQLD